MILFVFILSTLITGGNLFAGVRTTVVGASAPRCHRPQTQIKNSGFELGPAYWKDIASDLIGARLYSDSTVAYEGQRALKIDLEKARRFPEGSFTVASPWLTLAKGGNFSFSIYVKTNRPQTKVTLRIYNAVTTQGLRSGKQQQKLMSKEFICSENWRQLIFTGQLPSAEKDNYRFAVQLTEPAVYWLDQVELLHDGRARTSTPEIEAVLQPVSAVMKLYDAPGRADALLRIVNSGNHQHRLRFLAQQRARLNIFEQSITASIELAPHQIYSKLIQFEVPYADVYEISWQLLDQNSTPVQSGATRLAAINPALPHAASGEPVWGMHLDHANLETSLPILRHAGIRFLRNVANLHWNLVEAERDKWKWPDSLVQYLKAQGFSILGKLAYTPKWAVDPVKLKGWPLQNKMPVSMELYRNYIHHVVSHYHREIDYWEIWNEPNLPRYFDGTPEEYASLLAVARAEIKTAQPNAKVAGYAITKFYDTATWDYVRTVIKSQPALRLDAFSFHPYAILAPEEVGLLEKIDQYRALFSEHQGYDPQLWITELGYPGKDTVNNAVAYHPPALPRTVDELSQAAYLVRAAGLSKAAGVKYFFAYAMDSERVDRGPDIYGLLDEEWAATPKPALLAYLTLASLLGEAKFEKRIELNDPALYLLQFQRRDGKKISLLWRTNDERDVNLPQSLPRADRYDLLGNRINSSAATTISAGPIPIYLMY